MIYVSIVLVHMSFFKLLKNGNKKNSKKDDPTGNTNRDDDRRVEKVVGRSDDDNLQIEGTKLVYFVCQTPDEQLTEVLQTLTKDPVQVSIEKFPSPSIDRLFVAFYNRNRMCRIYEISQ